MSVEKLRDVVLKVERQRRVTVGDPSRFTKTEAAICAQGLLVEASRAGLSIGEYLQVMFDFAHDVMPVGAMRDSWLALRDELHR